MSESPSDPSHADLAALVLSQAKVIESQAAAIEALTARVAELERQLGQNSRNSSLPPSSDRFAKAKRPPRGTGRKPGKQPGAPGAGLEMVADVQDVRDLLPDACGGCGQDLSALVNGGQDAGFIRRQVHDLPEPVAVQVREGAAWMIFSRRGARSFGSIKTLRLGTVGQDLDHR